MTIAFQLGGERVGHAVKLEGEFLTARIARAFAPGSPVSAELCREAERIAVDLKAVGSKRVEGSDFEVRFRVVNITRLRRGELERWFA